MTFQKRKAIREGDNDQSVNIENDILAEGALNKALIFPRKPQMLDSPGRQIMRLLMISKLNNFM